MIGDAIGRFKTGRYIVTRPGTVTFVGGRAVTGTPRLLSIDASVQPAGARDLERLPEGERSADRIVIFTTTELLTTDAAKSRLGDRITHRDRMYEVESVVDYSTLGGYYRAVARKVEL